MSETWNPAGTAQIKTAGRPPGSEENESRTVYAVGAGEYDQYGIVVAFETEALAEEAVGKGVGESIEAIEVLGAMPEPCTCYRFEGRLRADGNVSLQRRRDLLAGPGIAKECYPSWDYCVPEPPVVRTDAWDSADGPHVAAEVCGRTSDACRQLLVETLERLSVEFKAAR